MCLVFWRSWLFFGNFILSVFFICFYCFWNCGKLFDNFCYEKKKFLLVFYKFLYYCFCLLFIGDVLFFFGDRVDFKDF